MAANAPISGRAETSPMPRSAAASFSSRPGSTLMRMPPDSAVSVLMR
jgi:hypothetical protein